MQHRQNNRAVRLAILILTSTLGVSGYSAAQHTATLKPFSAIYELKQKGITIAEIAYELKSQQKGWVLTTHAKPAGLGSLLSRQTVSEQSEFSIRSNRLQPLSYSRKHSDRKQAANQDQLILYGETQAKVTSGATATSISLTHNTYDVLSLQLAIALDLQQNKLRRYKVIDEGELEAQQYRLVGSEPVRLNEREYNAVKLERRYGNKQIIMWFAPELDYLLIKMQKYRKDELKTDLALSGITIQ